MKAMLFIAFIPLLVLAVQPLGYLSFWIPVLFIGIGASAHQAWSANIFTTVSDMFPKKSVGSIIGIGGMAGGIGGVVISKVGGWLFDAYKLKGIHMAINKANEIGLSPFLQKVNSLHSLDAKGGAINLVEKDWSHLADKLVQPIQAMDPVHFEQFSRLQKQLIQQEMFTAYSFMFAYCAIAYLLAWRIMKWLVPKEKIINLP
jgi:ACS family hexuronate transporter-like MFS transporter